MKKIALIAGLFLGVATLSAQTITLEQENVEFGEVKINTKNKGQIIVKNTGEAPLVIERVQPACGCTVPEFTKDPIAPGSTGTIDVEYNSGNAEGAFNKTVTIYSNDKASPRKIFRVKGTAVK